MSARISRLLAGAVLTVLAWMFAVTVTAHADEASREVNGEFSTVRLLNGGEKMLPDGGQALIIILRHAMQHGTDPQPALRQPMLQIFQCLQPGTQLENSVLNSGLSLLNLFRQLNFLMIGEQIQLAHFPKINIHRVNGMPAVLQC